MGAAVPKSSRRLHCTLVFQPEIYFAHDTDTCSDEAVETKRAPWTPTKMQHEAHSDGELCRTGTTLLCMLTVSRCQQRKEDSRCVRLTSTACVAWSHKAALRHCKQLSMLMADHCVQSADVLICGELHGTAVQELLQLV